MRNALLVFGFAATDTSVILEDDKRDWMQPRYLLGILDDPKFEKRL
jgi:hypothetical protein